jgi:signal transduction histidine kinase/ActR/RegA family two-component response regulator
VPLRAYLGGLVVLFVLGAGAAALYGSTQAADDARDAATADARFGARLAASETGKGVAQLNATVAGAAANPGIAHAYAKPKDCALAFGGTDAYTTGHIDLIRTDGSVVCSSAKAKGSYASAPWLAQVLRAPAFLAPASDPVTGKQVVLAAAPIPGRGAIVAVFDLEGVGPSLRATYGGPRKLEFMLTDGATVITRSRDPVHGIGQRLSGPPDRDGSRVWASAPVAGTGWRVYANADKAQALAATRRLDNRELSIIVAGLLLFMLAVFVVHRRIARPLERLSGEVRVAAAEGTPHTLPVEGPREIATLAQRLNDLGDAVAEKERLQLQLQQSQRLESLGQLAGGIAHDFNNLLAVILGYSTFIARRAVEGSDDERDVGEIRKAGERATRLTHQLLAFARRETVRPRVLDLTGVVLEMEQLLRRTLGEHVELETALAADLWPIMADYGQLEQVLVNLAVNARDAMPQGGTLTLDTENVAADDAYAAARPGLAPGRYVRLRVSDTGTGMAPDVAARAFEPFFTTKPKGEGTGLGLATIYGIVTGAGGNVQIYSEPGLGTTFTVLLPATDAPMPELDDRREPRRGHGETILVVEDEAAMLEVTRRLLEDGGYTVLTASGGEEALRIAAGHPGEIHLLLTDVVMPGMLGREVAARVTELRPGIGVLYMSGYAQAVIGPMGDLSAGHTILDKPFTEAALFERVAEALSRASAEPPRTA